MYFYEIYHKTIRKPGNLGNQLSAAFIVRQMLKWRDGQFDQRPAPLNIEPSWLTNEEVQELLLQKNILLYLDTTTQGVLNDEHVVEHDGWSVFEDVKGKPGLISNTPGAKFTISFQIDPVYQNSGKEVSVIVQLLHSYEGVGVAKLSLLTNENKSHKGEELVSTSVSCLWDDHASGPSPSKLQWIPTTATGNSENVDEFKASIEVQKAPEAKVKVFSITVLLQQGFTGFGAGR